MEFSVIIWYSFFKCKILLIIHHYMLIIMINNDNILLLNHHYQILGSNTHSGLTLLTYSAPSPCFWPYWTMPSPCNIMQLLPRYVSWCYHYRETIYFCVYTFILLHRFSTVYILHILYILSSILISILFSCWCLHPATA